jgi:NAD(P)-dependent dehydrogenase (short-subunit alcohol dehydrogenase family)
VPDGNGFVVVERANNQNKMARVFITGSADGLGQMAAALLVKQGHQVVLHARNEDRGRYAMSKVPGAERVLIADLSSMEETKNLAAEVNSSGHFDAIIHNAGVYQVSIQDQTVDGLPLLFTVNSLAPYILTAMIQKPERLVYLSSGMHMQGNSRPNSLEYTSSGFRNTVTYSDTKLHDIILCKAVARIWTGVYANAVNPGWVPTRMGGSAATDNLEKGFQTQVWLAVSDDEKAKVSGRYFYHQKENRYLAAADDISLQEKFISLCAQISGIDFPSS